MAMKRMYFGTRERMVWVKAPAINADLSKNKWSTSGTYLNGGGYARSSVTGHMVYQFSWNLDKAENIYAVLDYESGLYGSDLIYFLDPFALTENVLPVYWSAPRLAWEDAPFLIKDQRPTLVQTEANDLGYPTRSALYTVSNASVGKKLFIPVPPGYTFHIGVHGTSTGSANIRVVPTGLNGVDGPEVIAPMMSVTGEQRVNTSVSAVQGVTLRLGGTGTVSIAGIIAQVLPDGQNPLSGGFISGRGHSGVRFDGPPAVSGYSAPEALDKLGATATLRETGSWE